MGTANQWDPQLLAWVGAEARRILRTRNPTTRERRAAEQALQRSIARQHGTNATVKWVRNRILVVGVVGHVGV